jgi:hypothetical protein
MYLLEYTNVNKNTQRTLRFNSISAILKFMNEIVNDKDVRAYVERLRNQKKLDALNFAQNEKQLYPMYGDVDSPIPMLSDVAYEVTFDNKEYEYRIGTSDPMFYEGVGRISFRIKNIRQRIESSETSQLNNRNTQFRQVVSNEYSRSNHD